MIYNLNIKNHNLQFFAGLLIFFIVNLFTAATMGIHYDEAYYWLFSQSPALGYFDHPPMISWLIFAGTKIFGGVLGIRLVVLLLSAATICLLWILTTPYGKNAFVFWALVYSVLLIHPYTFIATPDSPMLFFTALFFVVYRKYTLNESLPNVLLLSVVTALLFYSKYHGILLVLFVVLADIKWLLNKKFWIFFALVTLLMVPHLIWQINNNFASFRYHLIDSHKTAYNPLLSLEYLASQVLVTGPWLGWLFLLLLFRAVPNTKFDKALKWFGAGVFIFFFVTTFGGDFEAHWTLVAVVPLIILSYKYFLNNERLKRWLYISGAVNFAVLLAVRIVVLSPVAEKVSVLKLFKGWDTDAQIIQAATGDCPVLFQDSWNRAARFGWYTDNKNISNLNSGIHRSNQFDIWMNHKKLKGQTVCVVSSDSSQFSNPLVVQTNKETWYIKRFENFRSYYGLNIEVLEMEPDLSRFSVKISNPYNEKINLHADSINMMFCLYSRLPGGWELIDQVSIGTLNIEPGKSVRLAFGGLNATAAEWPNVYLMLRIGELNPLPSKHRIK